jgi:hypothetical protein
MNKKYNYLRIIIDVIKFKLNIKDIKKFKKISDICDKIEENNASVSDLISLCKYKPKDFIKLINFHNKYVIDNDDKITINLVLNSLYSNVNKYKQTMIYNKIPILDLIKNIETIINKK